MRNNFVQPDPIIDRQQSATVGNTTVNTGVALAVDEALTISDGAKEVTSNMDRATALVVRLAPFSVVWLVLAVGVSWVAGMGWPWVLLVFAGLTALTYGRMLRTDYEYSRNGLERHKVNSLVYLKEKEMDQGHELRTLWLTAQIRQLEGGYDARTIEGAGSTRITDSAPTQRRITGGN